MAPDRKRYFTVKVIKLLQNIMSGNKTGKKISVLFDTCEKFHYYHIEPIIQQLANDKRFSITLVHWNNITPDEMHNSIKYISFDSFWYNWCKTFDVFISTELERIPYWLKDTHTVCVFHGAGPKMSYICNPMINEYNTVFSVGPTTYNVQTEYVSSSVTVMPIGLPVTDKLLSDNLPLVPDTIYIDKNKPTLLYAPSWSVNPEHISMDQNILDALANIEGYNIIIRPHPFLMDPKKCGGTDWKPALERIKNHGAQISLSDHSVYQILPHVDVLLADISSVIYEFLILDRPILLYMKESSLSYYDAIDFIIPLTNASIKLSTANDLQTALQEITILDSKTSAARKTLLNSTLFNIGHATEQATNAIKTIGLKSQYKQSS